MRNCEWYRVHPLTIKSNEVKPTMQRAAPQVLHVPWCAHAQSPAPGNRVTTPGAGTRLQCGGDMARCQIPGLFSAG